MRDNFAESGVGLKIEDDDGAVTAAIADETAIRFGDDGYAVGDLLAGDVAEGLAGVGVDDHGVRAARDKEAMG